MIYNYLPAASVQEYYIHWSVRPDLLQLGLYRTEHASWKSGLWCLRLCWEGRQLIQTVAWWILTQAVWVQHLTGPCLKSVFPYSVKDYKSQIKRIKIKNNSNWYFGVICFFKCFCRICQTLSMFADASILNMFGTILPR